MKECYDKLPKNENILLNLDWEMISCFEQTE